MTLWMVIISVGRHCYSVLEIDSTNADISSRYHSSRQTLNILPASISSQYFQRVFPASISSQYFQFYSNSGSSILASFCLSNSVTISTTLFLSLKTFII